MINGIILTINNNKMKTKNLLFAIALTAMFFLPSLLQVLPFVKDLGWASCSAQNYALILDGGYTVLNGGTSSRPVYLVVDQSSTLGIVRYSGHIISEGQYNYIKF